MPIYVYETLPKETGGPVRRFEMRQSMNDPALTKDPETGEPVRRVITGGYGVLTASRGTPAPAPKPSGGCGSGCGCH